MAMQAETQAVDIHKYLMDREVGRAGIHAAAPEGFRTHPFADMLTNVVVNVGRSTLFDRPVRIPTASFRETSLASTTQRNDHGVNPWLQLLAFPLGLGALGAGVGALANPGKRWEYALKGGLRGFGGGSVLNGAACGPSAEMAPATATEAAPLPGFITPETAVPTVSPELNMESVPGAMYPWQIVPADLTGIGAPLIYSNTSMYNFENGDMGIFHPLTDGVTADTSRSYALGIASFFNATDTVLTPTLLEQQGSGAVEAGMLQKKDHPDDKTWEYRILKMDVDTIGTKTLSEDSDTLVQRQAENGFYTFALRDASGNETQLALDMGVSAEPTATPPTQVPNDVFANVFNTPDAQLISFKTGTSIVSVPTAVPEASPTPVESIDPDTGWKMQMVDGEKQLFSPDINEWVVLGGKVPLIEHDDRPYTTLEDAFMMEVYYKAGFPGPKISEAPVNVGELDDFTGMFQIKLAERAYGNAPNKLPSDFQNKLQNGDFDFSFTTTQGESKFEVSSASKYRVYVMPFEDVALRQGYVEVGDKDTNKKMRIVSTADGKNAISIVGIDYPLADLKKTSYMHMIMYTLSCIMDPNQGVGLYTNPIQLRPSGMQEFVNPKITTHIDVANSH